MKLDRTTMMITMSSRFGAEGECDASHALDGIFQTTFESFDEMACTATGDLAPWMQLDLGQEHTVHEASTGDSRI